MSRKIYRLKKASKIKSAPNDRSVFLYEQLRPYARIVWEDVNTGVQGVLPPSLGLKDFKLISVK